MTAVARFSLLGALTLVGAGVANAQDIPGCTLEIFAAAPAAGVIDARTFRIEDGREVRLAAIEPPAPDGAAGSAAKTALEKLLAGNKVVLKLAAPATDRYGHLVAQAFVVRD